MFQFFYNYMYLFQEFYIHLSLVINSRQILQVDSGYEKTYKLYLLPIVHCVKRVGLGGFVCRIRQLHAPNFCIHFHNTGENIKFWESTNYEIIDYRRQVTQKDDELRGKF